MATMNPELFRNSGRIAKRPLLSSILRFRDGVVNAFAKGRGRILNPMRARPDEIGVAY
jgi:hypothetical protein